MKRFVELSEEQQEKAIDHYLGLLVESLVEGHIRFDDGQNGDNLQDAIDCAIAESNRKQTPWFAGEYVMDVRYRPMEGHVTDDDGMYSVADHLRSMASCDAEDAVYLEPGERALSLAKLEN